MLEAGYSRIFQTVLLFLIPVLLCSLAYSKVIYVDDDAAGANDGTNWENAYFYLQDALADANSAEKPIEIRVAQGIYRPNQGFVVIPEFDWRTSSFQLINGVTLRGGYSDFSEPHPDEWHVETYETILSGDLAGNDIDVNNPEDLFGEPTRAENSHHVVTGSGTDETAVLDGFTITGGAHDPWSIGLSAGMYIDSGSPTVNNCTFTGNWAGHGAGMDNDSGSPTLTNCTFSGNSGIWGTGMFNHEGNPILIDCTFNGNCGAWGGGGMYNSGGSPTLTNCVFIGNIALGGFSGGGMYNERSNPTLTDCTFIENLSHRGGGMHNSKSNPTLTGCTFSRNYARNGGGMQNIDSSPQLIDCTFSENSAHSGGGMANGASHPTLTNCTFGENSADSRGGGVYNSRSSSFILDKCTFTANAADSGGGTYNRESDPKLTGCAFRGNSARHGAGMYNSESDPKLIGCAFSGNSAVEYGGGVRNWYSNPILTNCTFAQNSARNGNALACNSSKQEHSSSVELINCILWDGGNEIWNNDNSTIMITYTNIQGGFPCEGNIEVDPLFADPGYWADVNDPNIIVEPSDSNAVWIGGDYHLKSEAGRWDAVSESWVMDNLTSPCIDAGDPNRPVAFEPDPNGGRINMGAYAGTAEASKSPGYSWFFETTHGPVPAEGLGIVLPHEHIFTDLRGPTTPGYGQADAADVVRVMAPLLADAREKGVGVMIECTSIGVGRNVAVVTQVAEASGLPVVVPTGVYGRANFAPPEHRNMTEDELATLFINEIKDGIEGTGIKAGFIKIATDEGPMNALIERILRAAGRAASETGAAIASHTPTGSNAVRQVDILEAIDPAIRFIWVHAQNESNRNIHRQLTARGVYIEFDSLGWSPGQDSTYISAIKELLAAGHGDRILLSHDAGWYQPGSANGGTQKPFTYLIDTFIPKLRDTGVDDATIRMITQTNPVRAFGFKSGE